MSEHVVYLDERFSPWERQVPTVAPGEGAVCSVCELARKRDCFRAGDGKYGVYTICRDCERVLSRERKAVLHQDPEERAKHVLRQRAQKGRISWQLWRELREQKRCAEWLAEHPFSSPPRGPYGYVYVLMSFTEEVLYVGQTIHVETRLYIQATSHKYDKDWWPEVALVDVYTYHAKDYDEGERWLIQELNPVYNKVRPKPRRETKPEPLSVVRGSIYEGVVL